MNARGRRTRQQLRRAAAVAFAAVLVVAVAGFWPASPPGFEQVREAYRPSEAYLLDRNGLVLDSQRVDFGERRLAWTRLDDVSPALIEAVIAGEDHRFRRHGGVDWLSAASAARQALGGEHSRGASTITMQLASLLAQPPTAGRRTLWQKLHQVRAALGLELAWSKDEILEAYLNLAPFRGELLGVTAASQLLARKAPSGLTAAEAQVLAALLPGPAAGVERVATRACGRLSATSPALTCTQLHDTAAALLGPGPPAAATERLAPHVARALLKVPGERVTTTLDRDVQALARDALAHQLGGLATRNVRDGAVLVVDNASGDVLAYVGASTSTSRAAQVDGVRAPRQAGSTLKPFLYGLALERRYLTAASLVEDSPVNIDTPSGLYLPQDYDHDYKGWVSLRTALAGSLNVPAVRSLMLLGLEPFRERLQAVGYRGIDHEATYYGYALALGSAEVSLWEQAQAYRVLARGGESGDLRLRAEDPPSSSRRLLPAGASFIIADILSDKASRAITFGLDNVLATRYWSAVKTGTSKDMRDNWCIGFTPRFTVAVWVGNFEGDAMRGVSGVTGAAPVWREVLDGLQAQQQSAPPTAPAAVRRTQVSFARNVEPARQEWFLDGSAASQAVEVAAVAAQSPKIVSPTNGMVVAIDPDIPASGQRVPLTAAAVATGAVFRLDGTILAEAGRTQLWAPKRGAHRLVLESSAGHALDQILFTVR
jgi:penicillin-binding protein 1C